MRRFLTPILIAVGLGIISWALRELPPPVASFLRFFNGFVITVLLIWIVQQILGYDGRLNQHRRDILDVVKQGQEDRRKDLSDLAQQTADIALRLSEDTKQKTAEMEKQTEKIESIRTTSEETNDILKKVL